MQHRIAEQIRARPLAIAGGWVLLVLACFGLAAGLLAAYTGRPTSEFIELAQLATGIAGFGAAVVLVVTAADALAPARITMETAPEGDAFILTNEGSQVSGPIAVSLRLGTLVGGVDFLQRLSDSLDLLVLDGVGQARTAGIGIWALPQELNPKGRARCTWGLVANPRRRDMLLEIIREAEPGTPVIEIAAGGRIFVTEPWSYWPQFRDDLGV